jgi:hypothetical protein
VVEIFEKIVNKLRGMSPLWEEFQRGKVSSVIHPQGQAAARPIPDPK